MDATSSDRVTRRTWLTGAAAVAAEAGMVPCAVAASDPLSWTLTEAAAALAKRTVSSEELTKLCMARISKVDRPLNAFITIQGDSAHDQARASDRRRKAGRVSSRLDGVPI